MIDYRITFVDGSIGHISANGIIDAIVKATHVFNVDIERIVKVERM